MISSLIQFHDHLPLIVRWLFDFMFEIIIVRGILAPKIVSDIKQQHLTRVNIIHDIVYVINKFIPDKDSRKVITEHWRMHVMGEGHEADSAGRCYDGQCSSLA